MPTSHRGSLFQTAVADDRGAYSASESSDSDEPSDASESSDNADITLELPARNNRFFQAAAADDQGARSTEEATEASSATSKALSRRRTLFNAAEQRGDAKSVTMLNNIWGAD